MAVKNTEKNKSGKIADVASVILFIFICAVFIIDTLTSGTEIDYIPFAAIVIAAMIFFIVLLRNTIIRHRLSFSIPLVLFALITSLVIFFPWEPGYYLFLCFAFTAVSCIYSNFTRTMVFFLIENLTIGLFVLRGELITGYHMPVHAAIINWSIFMFSGIIIMVLTRAATVHLDNALEYKTSFMDLLDTAENYVAMVNQQNEVVYASKTLAQLSNTDEQGYIQGRPLLDLFPGRTLKIYAGKMLKEKDNYAEDWEFSLNGQKRYFKAASHNLRGGSGDALISLYDMTHLAERDEIAVMKDNMKIGLFFMDKHYIIQDHYSRYLEEMLMDTRLFGREFTEIISDSVSPSELDAIKDYFKMILERSYDQEMLDDINPLSELHYINKSAGEKKVFQFAFATVERAHSEVFILVTVYDITARVELQQRLEEEELRRQEEMQAVFELIQVEPGVFNDFMMDMEYEFDNIDKILKNDVLTTHEALVKIYQSVHAIKSNAVTLGLNIFGNKVHNLESTIKKLREMGEDVTFSEMLNLTMDIEKIANEKEGFRTIIGKLQKYAGSGKDKVSDETERQNVKVLIESLAKTTAKAAEDMGKLISFSANNIDPEAMDIGPRRIIKEVLIQLIRNSAVHGIEMPDARIEKGKNETGAIKLSIKLTDDRKHIHIKLSDDGQGLDYKKIAETALERNLIKPEDAENRDALLKIIFAPGFSTAKTEDIHGGRGIGLNLVRDRVKEVKGTVKLKSEDGKGILFLITIPVQNN